MLKLWHVVALCPFFWLGSAESVKAAQDIPPQDVLDAIFPRPATPGQPAPPLEIRIVPVSQPVTGSCTLQRAQLRQTRGSTVRTFELLVDKATPESPDPTQLFVGLKRLTVDGDGSARAYHPEDPLGVGVCQPARNSIGDPWVGTCAVDALSSANIHVFRGTAEIPPSKNNKPNPDYASAWNEFWPLIKQKKATPIDLRPLLESPPSNVALYYSADKNLAVYFKNTKIIPFKDNFPCLRAVTPTGYFVAGTAKRIAENPDVCNPAQYLDALAVPFFVIPGNVFKNIKVGDLAIGHAKVGAEDRLVFGIVGDTGRVDQIGEGSIAFNQALFKRTRAPMNAAEANTLDINTEELPRELSALKSLSVLMLGGTAPQLNGNYSRQNIEAVAKVALRAWAGGNDFVTKLTDCALSTPSNKHRGTVQ